MSKELTALEWLRQNSAEVLSAITTGKESQLKGRDLDCLLFENFSALMREAGVLSTSLPRNVLEFTKLRKQAGIEFPRGRPIGAVLEIDLLRVSDLEVRNFLSALPDDVKRLAYRKAERQFNDLVGVIQDILEEFPHIDKEITREEFSTVLACVFGKESNRELIAGFALRILRKARLNMRAEVVRTSIITRARSNQTDDV